MNDQIAVIPRDLRRAGQNMSSVADDVSTANPSGHMAKISSAMPGSNSAEQVGNLESKLESRFTSLAKRARDYRDGMSDAANAYETADDAAQARAEHQAQLLDQIR